MTLTCGDPPHRLVPAAGVPLCVRARVPSPAVAVVSVTVVAAAAFPPGAEASSSRSRSMPVSRPCAAVRSVSPARKARALAPHGETARPSRLSASDVDPDTETPTGLPFTVSRSVRQVAGTFAGSGGTRSPAMSTSAKPVGMATGWRLR